MINYCLESFTKCSVLYFRRTINTLIISVSSTIPAPLGALLRWQAPTDTARKVTATATGKPWGTAKIWPRHFSSETHDAWLTCPGTGNHSHNFRNAAEQSSKELASLKERNKAMEEELKELHERYSEISLRFAEVEGERQQLVMTVRSLKNSLRWQLATLLNRVTHTVATKI